MAVVFCQGAGWGSLGASVLVYVPLEVGQEVGDPREEGGEEVVVDELHHHSEGDGGPSDIPPHCPPDSTEDHIGQLIGADGQALQQARGERGVAWGLEALDVCHCREAREGNSNRARGKTG